MSGVGVRNLPVVVVLGLALAGCASSAHHGARYPAGQPHYTVAPYKVNGVWYYPKVDYAYDRSGTASWYGPGFDHRLTADGEIYDMNGLSAAHKTLPLPSVVEVTNLQNGRELRLRVNDRGPFIGDRLIDVSRRAAQLLGFEKMGTTPVRVRILRDDSIRVAEAAMHGEMGRAMVAQAARPAPVRLAAATPPPAPVISPMPAPAPAPVIAPPQPAAMPPQVAMEPPQWTPPPMAAPPAPAQPSALVPAGRHYWPSLIASAHAETLRPVRSFASPRGRIFVQAGAFAVADNARRLRARIAGFANAEVVPARVNGETLYRVRLGPVANEAAARRLLARLVDGGYRGARLVGD